MQAFSNSSLSSPPSLHHITFQLSTVQQGLAMAGALPHRQVQLLDLCDLHSGEWQHGYRLLCVLRILFIFFF